MDVDWESLVLSSGSHDVNLLRLVHLVSIAGRGTDELAVILGAVKLDGVLTIAVAIGEHERRIALVHRFTAGWEREEEIMIKRSSKSCKNICKQD